MHDSTISDVGSRFAKRLKIFKLIFVPLLIFSLAGQIAVVWTQLADIRDGYFDFVLYYGAARIVADGKGAQLYDLTVQKDYQKDARATPQTRPLPFNHLPFELLALIPISQLSFPAAHGVWAAMNSLVLLVILFRLTPFVTAVPRSLMIVIFVAFFPTMTTLKMGQDSLITTYLLTETLISLKCRRHALAGCLLALGLYKPQFVLPITAILLFHRRWAAIGAFLLTASILAGVSLAMVGWQGVRGLLALWLPMTARGHVVWPELMINLRGLLFIALDIVGMTWATNFLTLVISVAVFSATLCYWRQDDAELTGRFELQFALAMVMTVLVSFHLYSYDGLLLVIPLVLMLDHVLKEQLQSLPQRLFLPLLIVMFIPWLPNALLGYAMLAWWALPVPLLFAIIAWELGRQSKLTQAGVRM